MKSQANLFPAKRAFFSLIWSGALLLVVLASCTDQTAARRQQSLSDMQAYVKAHKDSIDQYLDKSLDQMDQELNEKKAVVDSGLDKLSEDSRKAYDRTLQDWDSVKVQYTARHAVKAQAAQIERVGKIHQSLAKSAKKLDFSDLGGADMAAEYDNFVTNVKANKEIYSSEDWTSVNKLWKDLNHRRKAVKADISAPDMKKINKLRLEYTAIKAVNRPIAKSSDDVDQEDE